MTLLELHGDVRTSCGYHRLALPFAHLQLDLKVPTLVFNRHVRGGPAFLEQKRRAGFRIVADLDDLWDLPPEHYLARAWAISGTPARIRACLAAADVVMVTNDDLAAHVAAVNPNVVVVPNALPFDVGQFTRSRVPGDTFVYAAGPSHVPDVAALRSVFDQETVTIAGADAHPEWKRMHALVPQAKQQASRPAADYMRLYDGHMAALAPLLDNPFNRCKSNLKTLEAGAKGLPLIASDVRPYRNPADERHVLYASSAQDWHDHMRALAAYPRFAEDAGAALAEHVRKHYHLDQVNEIRRQVLESAS